MKNWLVWIAQALKFALVLVMGFTLIGCGPLLTLYVSLTTIEKEEANIVTPLKDDEIAQVIADRFGLMALFAYVSYRKDLLKTGNLTSACDWTKPAAEPDNYGMPKSDAQKEGRWLRWKGKHSCVNDESGLFYETYVYKKNETAEIQEAVISFRGTEDSLDDWITNVSPTFGIQPEQYFLASEKLPDLIKALKKNNKKVKIYAAGHSLGGGLAQQAGYQFKDILEVFTFNTSPVTNWTYLRFRGKVQKEYPTVYRIYHGGEILEKLRFFTTSFTSTSYRRYDLGIQFHPRKIIKGHSMKILVCGFAAIIASDGDNPHDAAHHYGRKYVRDKILEDPNTQDKDLANPKICGSDSIEMVNQDKL